MDAERLQAACQTGSERGMETAHNPQAALAHCVDQVLRSRRSTRAYKPDPVSAETRFAPVRDQRVTLALLTSVFANGGLLMVYTYVGLVLDRTTGGSEQFLATVLLFWGVSATIGNSLPAGWSTVSAAAA
jgi:predicted MFS family arabinose efflux permease